MDVFAQRRTHRRGAMLGLGQLACLGPHTVTGLLSVLGKHDKDWSADYRFFSQDQWKPQQLFESVLKGTLELLPSRQPVFCAMDDTLLRKTGVHIPDVAYRRDPLSPPFHTNLVRGQRFLQLSILLPAGTGPSAARAIPIRFEPAPPLPKPSAKDTPGQCQELKMLRRTYNLSTIGRDAIHATRQQLDKQEHGRHRTLVVGVDGSYTNQTVLRSLPDRTTLIGRVRKDIKLFEPPPEAAPARGRPRRYGAAVASPATLLKDESQPWQTIQAFAAGKMHDFCVKTLAPVLWAKAGPDLPLRMVVIAPLGYRLRKGGKLLYRQPAFLICTDLSMDLAQLVQAYIWRWQIEVDHRDEKQLIGVGEAQVSTLQSARREPVFAVACYAKLLLAAAELYGLDATRDQLPLPLWRRNQQGSRLTTSDLLRQLRQDLWGEALKRVERNSSHFVNARLPTTSGLKIQVSLPAALNHAASG